MLNYISDKLLNYNIDLRVSTIESSSVIILIMILTIVFSKIITDKILIGIIKAYLKKRKNIFLSIMLKKNFFDNLSNIIPAIIIYFFISTFPIEYQYVLEKAAFTYLIIMIILVIDSLLNSIVAIYDNRVTTKEKSIKGFVQVIKITIYICGIIIIISYIINKSPIIILSGIGAFTAVFLLVFRDTLLGIVAGIQISANDIVRIGDWIDMPKYGASGSVKDILLNTIKVENYDKTVTTIPSYAFISDSFKNWRHMEQSGARLIKRSVYVDINSIMFCTPEMIEKFKNMDYISNYIIKKQIEIDQYNRIKDMDPLKSANSKRLTNIGVFREYIQQYLRRNPNIHKHLTQVVRELEPSSEGLPIEIYVYSNVTAFNEFEKIQSDMFDHIFSVASEFNIRFYQNPTGHDFKKANEVNIESKLYNK